jgi:putative glycosyltransferase (TIGR04372 family)
MQKKTDVICFIKSTNTKKILIDFQRINRESNRAEQLWNQGNYKISCEIYKNCLEEIYLSKKIDMINYVPMYLSNGWIGAFGHIGLLGTFLTAQELGIIPAKKRTIAFYTEEQSQLAKLFFGDKLILSKSYWKTSVLEHPSQWHISERLMMVKILGSFVPLYEMADQVFASLNAQNRSSPIEINLDYESRARNNLSLLGLPQDAWFVGFHLREKLDPLDSRQVDLSNFLPSLREISKNGGWIVRFGTGKMEEISSVRNLINLNEDNPGSRYLHPYILAKSKFLLSADSGPCALAKSLGTPVLQTNTTSIARNMTTASKGSLYLPKIWIKDGENCSYAEIVSSLEGYSETNLKQKNQAGYKLRQNTEDEILEATKDMLECAANKANGRNIKKLEEIRQNFNVVGHGAIAPSFLNKHESWYLN